MARHAKSGRTLRDDEDDDADDEALLDVEALRDGGADDDESTLMAAPLLALLRRRRAGGLIGAQKAPSRSRSVKYEYTGSGGGRSVYCQSHKAILRLTLNLAQLSLVSLTLGWVW